jgi:ABC-type phosphate transport system substrate-binding protein
MSKKSLQRLAALLVFTAPLLAHAGDVLVVAHAGLTLSPDDIRDVFTGDKQTAGSVKLVPLDNGAAQADFLAKVVKVDAAKYASIWSKKAFREGINPPPVRATDAEILAAVKSTPGAIGYVSKAGADVKVLQKY